MEKCAKALNVLSSYEQADLTFAAKAPCIIRNQDEVKHENFSVLNFDFPI